MIKPNPRRILDALLVIILGISAYIFISLFSYDIQDPAWSHTTSQQHIHNLAGSVGALIADIFFYLFGYYAYILPAFLMTWSIYLMQHDSSSSSSSIDNNQHDYLLWLLKGIGAIGLMIGLCSLSSIYYDVPLEILPESSGGALGGIVEVHLIKVLNLYGATIALVACTLASITLLTGLSWIDIISFILRSSSIIACKIIKLIGNNAKFLFKKINTIEFKKYFNYLKALNHLPTAKHKSMDNDLLHESKTKEFTTPVMQINEASLNIQPPKQAPATQLDLPSIPQLTLHNKPLKLKKAKPTRTSAGLPASSLLDSADNGNNIRQYTKEELAALSHDVEVKLLDFGIEVKVVSVCPGPVITRFELNLAPGLKASKISGLAKDLARSLSVMAVRVVEVIPGKPVVGLEIPNQSREVVYFREIIESQEFQQHASATSLALGKDIAGFAVIADLAKMPHLLVAGTTGSGKSVGVNAMLISMLYKSTPEDVRLLLIDPKMLELSIYDGIGHLLTPVITDMKEASKALNWCVAEMERRYQLMAAVGVRNLSGFNSKIEAACKSGNPIIDPLIEIDSVAKEHVEPVYLQKLPYIVVIIDEFADMIMVVGKKVEELIARIAQKARAAGIHLILATQRPSVDVITGLIKANVPTRIAFQVSSKIDSRTILDQQGAENLLGHGDMLYLPPGSGIPKRVHGAFVSDDEVHRVVEYLKEHGPEPDYIDDFSNQQGLVPLKFADDEEGDELYDEAVFIVTSSRKASISNLQRRLKIGYNRAARLIETMEEVGVVSPMQNSGGREVLAPPPVES